MNGHQNDFDNWCMKITSLKKVGAKGKEIMEALHVACQDTNIGAKNVLMDQGVLYFELFGMKIRVRCEGHLSESPNGMIVASIVPNDETKDAESLIEFKVDWLGNINKTYTVNDFSNPFFITLFSKLEKHPQKFPNLTSYAGTPPPE